MKVLIDSHVLLWWFTEPAKLSKRATALLSSTNNTVLVSAATAWELAIKVNLGKIDALPFIVDFVRHMEGEGFIELPITLQHALRAGLLPLHHRDPFDRLLVAQAQCLNVPILSADPVLADYDVKRLW